MNASTTFRLVRTLVLMALLVGLFLNATPASAANLLVNSANDNDDGYCDARHCSLREAINAANADPGWDRIDFNIPGAGPHIITLSRPLPAVTDNQTWILAASEPDFAGQPVVIIDGRLLPADAVGLAIQSSDNVVRGFSLVNFRRTAIEVTGSRNEIAGNFVGIAPGRFSEGSCDLEGGGASNGFGIDIEAGDGNIARDNVASCNGIGVDVGYSATGTIVAGNFIGTDPSGAYAIPNGTGVFVYGDASGTLIGGDEPSERNLISGNRTGILILTNDVRASGNRIGTNAAGDAPIGNVRGLEVHGRNHVIGGDTFGESNLISGNTTGLEIRGENITVISNMIGSDSHGVARVSNMVGIVVEGSGNTIGNPASANLIAYNMVNGVFVGRVHAPGIPGDLDILGNVIHGNGGAGIHVYEGEDILIRANTFYENEAAGVDVGDTRAEETVQRTTITVNFFERNGWEAILLSPGANGDIAPPILTAATRTSASGTACAGCIVEVFRAEPDPSGSGEGRDFLVSVTAGTDGVFAATFAEVEGCQEVTATATDPEGNTSEFSVNRVVGRCTAPPSPWLSAVILILGTAGGSAFMPDLRLGPLRLRGALRRLLGGLAGLAGGGAVLVIITLILGNVQTRQTEEPLPPCSDFLNENLSLPPFSAVFEPGTDVLIELSPQPDPPGSQTRWRVEVTGWQAGSRELTRATPSVRLSEFGFDPQIPGEYFWQVTGERLDQDGQTWEVFCEDFGPRQFSIQRPTPTATAQLPTSTPTPTPTATPTPTLATPMVIAHENAFCRYGPSQVYEAAAMLNQGQSAPIQGRSNDDNWWFVLPPGERYGCWVWAGAVDATGDFSGVPRRQAPPTPTSTPYGCWVQPCGQCPLVCTLPCPPNAVPGGACTP
ncbi:MAG: hypothetical protein A2Y93_13555 [Chloroflexi bacterium RBG_13_68_17]|nr:MAG: hypothetical protein A2Y93_13555 [Chloroflexi bacterium RBG_13_68_17]